MSEAAIDELARELKVPYLANYREALAKLQLESNQVSLIFDSS